MKNNLFEMLVDLFDETNEEPLNYDEVNIGKVDWFNEMKLFVDNNCYYILIKHMDQISDYSFQEREQWYKCNNNELTTGILIINKLTK